jgi:predicted RNA-binding Zn-ribbon protein involved in translation (DUF1610 family)
MNSALLFMLAISCLIILAVIAFGVAWYYYSKSTKPAARPINTRVEDSVNENSDVLIDESPLQENLPYLIRDDFLSPAELNFYLVLKSTTADWALVFTKVSLNDVFYARTSDPSSHRTYTNKIDRKHVDFLLCDPKTVKPILGIELDDKSHQRPDRQERDEFVQNVFAAAKLPLARIPVKHAYSVVELNSLLQKYVTKTEIPATQPVAEKIVDKTPACPKCGSSMILRTAKSGANQGGQFWGCSQYPQCRGIVNIGV